MKKKIISLLLLTIMTLSIIVPVHAANDSGKMGENATWNYDSSTETFTVSGTGSLYPFTFDDDTLEIDSPCDKYYTQVKKIARGSFMIITADDNVNVYYAGTEEEWNQLDKGADFYFKEAIMHYGATSTVSKANTKQTSTTTVANKTNADVSKKSTTSSDGIKVYIDNKIVSFDVQPQLIGGRTMVPLRAISRDWALRWNGTTVRKPLQRITKQP